MSIVDSSPTRHFRLLLMLCLARLETRSTKPHSSRICHDTLIPFPARPVPKPLRRTAIRAQYKRAGPPTCSSKHLPPPKWGAINKCILGGDREQA